jgi:predicted dehydrogenase
MAAGVQYRILFVGLGSIGQKHLKNVTTFLKSNGLDFQIDALRRQKSDFLDITNVYTKYEDIVANYDIIFITNPTSLHYEAIQFLKNRGKYFFIEKPIFDKVHNVDFLENTEKIYYVACPLRFHPIVKKLKDFAENNCIISFRAICSSYLPDWRRNTDYRENYSAQKSMGGGVELDLIHELDYLKWAFGKPKKTSVFLGKKSNLEIDSNDIAVYLFEFLNSIGSLHLDYFGHYEQKNKREIEIFTDNDTLLFDITNCLTRSSKTGISERFTSEDIHMNEIKYFFDTVVNDAEDYHNSPVEALESLKIALGEI